MSESTTVNRQATTNRALLYHSGAVGDFITTLPAIKLWRENNPDTSLTLLGNAAVGNLAIKAGYAEESLDLNRACFAELFRGVRPDRAQQLLGDINTGIVFASPSSPVLSAIRSLKPQHLFHQAPFPSKQQHVVDYHLGLFKSYYSLPDNALPQIDVPPAKDGVSHNQSQIVLHHGSGSSRKNWPIDHFRYLGRQLAHAGHNICWLQGPADSPPPAEGNDRVIKSDDLWEFAKILARARLFIGNDSGLSHLAAAVGGSVVVLFGASDPAVWRPLGANVTVIYAEYDCRPCHPTGPTRENCGHTCMAAISLEHVMAVCCNLLER